MTKTATMRRPRVDSQWSTEGLLFDTGATEWDCCECGVQTTSPSLPRGWYKCGSGSKVSHACSRSCLAKRQKRKRRPELDEDYVMPRGLYEGTSVNEVPDEYIGWVLDNVPAASLIFRACRAEQNRRSRL